MKRKKIKVYRAFVFRGGRMQEVFDRPRKLSPIAKSFRTAWPELLRGEGVPGGTVRLSLVQFTAQSSVSRLVSTGDET